uniref:Putative effector protein n=1 Tax=Heterodera avenae TaxID=34510 RepID=A0A2L0VDN3_HETAV|nr:putative effector protein [Heterodera avenae]
MTKFVGVFLLLCAWVQQIVQVSASPTDRVFFIEFNRDDLKNPQDDALKLANGIDDLKMANVIISPELHKDQTNSNGSTTNFEQKQDLDSGPLTVSVQLQTKSAEGNQYRINFTDTSFLLICSATFRVAVPSDTTLVNYWNMTAVPNTPNQYTLPDDVRIYPGLEHSAGVMLDGNGEPEVVILHTTTVLTTEKCPNDA